MAVWYLLWNEWLFGFFFQSYDVWWDSKKIAACGLFTGVEKINLVSITAQTKITTMVQKPQTKWNK